MMIHHHQIERFRPACEDIVLVGADADVYATGVFYGGFKQFVMDLVRDDEVLVTRDILRFWIFPNPPEGFEFFC